MKRAKRTILIISLALASCRGPVVSPIATPQVEYLRIMATAATAPLLGELLNAYSLTSSSSLTHALWAVDLTTAGWPAVSARLLTGDIPFATTLLVSDDLWAAPIALDGIAIIVHPTNSIPILTQADLRTIFLGRAATWETLGGPRLPITVTSYETGDDLRLSFETRALNASAITLGARLVLTSRGMIDLVKREPGAIGYITVTALTAADMGSVRVVPLDPGDGSPVMPTSANLASQRYPLNLPVLAVGREPPAPGTPFHTLFAWMQSEAGTAATSNRLDALGLDHDPGGTAPASDTGTDDETS